MVKFSAVGARAVKASGGRARAVKGSAVRARAANARAVKAVQATHITENEGSYGGVALLSGSIGSFGHLVQPGLTHL